MTRCVYFILLLACPFFIKAQNNFIDSLTKVINAPTTHDTIKAELLVSIAEETVVVKPDTTISVCRYAINFINHHINKSNTKIKTSLLRNKSLAFYTIARTFHDNGNTDSALYYYNKSLTISTQVNDQLGITYILNRTAGVYRDQGNIQKALEYYHKSIKNSKKIKQLDGSMGDNDAMASAYNGIGQVYEITGNLEESISYYKKGLKLREKDSLSLGYSAALNNIAYVYNLKGDTVLALSHYKKSLAICKQKKYKRGIATVSINMSSIYISQNNFLQALELCKEALTISTEIGNQEGVSSILRNLGSIYFKQGQLQKAKTHALKAMSIAQQLGYPETIKNMADLLKTIYENEGNYAMALQMHETFIKMHDSIANKENREAGIRQHFQYEYEKKSAIDKAAAVAQQKINKAKLNAQRKYNSILIGGVGLTLLFAALMLMRFNKSRKQKNIIVEQKKQVELQKQIIEQKQKELTDSIIYAKRIQQALLPSEKQIYKQLKKTLT